MKKVNTVGKALSWLLLLVLVFSPIGSGWSGVTAAPLQTPSSVPIFYISGDLAPGETVAPHYPLPGTLAKKVNMKMQVPAVAGDGAIDLDVTDGDGGNAFQGTILDGETLWATTTFEPGNNVFTIHNTSSETLDYELWVYEIEDIPYNWQGTSQGTGTWHSHVRLNFPSSGLYQFDFEATSGRFQFLVDGEYIQKTVEGAGTVSYYVAAGLHDLQIVPDSQSPTTDWLLEISGPGAGYDDLPYAKAGGNLGGINNDFDQEWLPLQLMAAAEANFSLTLTGNVADVLDIHLYQGASMTPTLSVFDVPGGETLWWTADLPAGLSRLQFEADGANTTGLAYELAIHAKPTTPAAWSGVSKGSANRSEIRFDVATAGLYDFDYGLTAGRYQFLVEAGPHIQKTVETTGTVRYYLPAGSHTLTIDHDAGQPSTNWSLEIAAAGVAHDTLPYHKAGGELGGAGNVFEQESLPLNLAGAETANFELTLDGDLNDGLVVEVYAGETLVYTTPTVYGGETFWWTTDLMTGTNYVRLATEGGNANSLQYDLTLHPVPVPPASWSGVAKGSGDHSTGQVQVVNGGIYHLSLETPVGFAQVLVDGAIAADKHPIESPDHLTEFDIPLAAGSHSFAILQDPAYLTTEWSLYITPTVASETIAHFAGVLVAGEQIDPQIPLLGASDKEVNFRLQLLEAAGGSQLDLTITDGGGGTAFAGTALDGETVWGSTTLTPGQNTFTLHNTGANPLTYDLTVYEIPTAAYDWAGESRGAGAWDSHIKLNFPQGALYDLGFDRTEGRYQFLVDDELIQKTVEVSGTVAYYIPAGDHLLTIVPDRATDTSWSLGTSAPGAANDSLPYTKTGGDLWADPAQFNEEWLPVQLATAAATNFALTLTGDAADAMDILVYDNLKASVVYSITDVYGGETVWWTTDLPAGTSRIQLLADGANGDALAYDLTIHEKPLMPGSWSGLSYGLANNSHIRFEVDAPGLYDLAYDVGPGRFQFLTASATHIQKTVEMSGTVRYYLAAGTHDLTIRQDPDQAITAWWLSIAPAGIAHDTLPYHQQGGNLGGTGNAFVSEWLPLELAAGQRANFQLTLTGDLDDGLWASLYQAGTQVYTSPLIYGGETFWWTAELGTGLNQLELVAEGANGAPLQYDLTIWPIPTVAYGAAYTWRGVAKDDGGNSIIDVQIPVSGTYQVAVDLPNGFANVFITDGPVHTHNPLPEQSHYEFELPLDEGHHYFRVEQNPVYITTTWTVTASLVEAAAPEITSISPEEVVNDTAQTLTINGAHFQAGATVEIDGLVLSPVNRLDSATLQVEIPAGLEEGTYSVTVTNPDGQSATLVDALRISPPLYYYYLPIVSRYTP